MRQLATRAALLLALGLGACNQAVDVQPQNSLDSSSGLTTATDAAAALIGCYDAVQATSYDQISYPVWGDLITGDIAEVGTFSTTYGQAANNAILADNIEIANMWAALYAAVGRCNYLLQQTETISDPAFTATVKATTQAEARCLRAYHYMNLLGYWGGSTNGYGYSGGLGVPLRLIPVNATTDVSFLARSSEADVVAAIRDDLTFAVANLSAASAAGSFRVNKNTALALRARLELRLRNYADALSYAKQVPTFAAFTTTAPAAVANDAIWQLYFSTTDKNNMAFYWYPTASGGRNEFDPTASFTNLHPTGDLRRAVNVQTSPAGTTAKYTSVSNGTDYFSCVRYAEVVLTIAESALQTGDLTTALTQDNVIRKRAGLLPLVIGTAPTPAPNPAVATYITPSSTDPTGSVALLKDIMLQRHLELAFEGHYWFDLRRTNAVQSTLTNATQAYRNLMPIPQRDVNLTNGVIAQNPGY